MTTVVPFNTQNVPVADMLSTQSIRTINIWFGVVKDLFTYPGLSIAISN